MGQAVYHYIKNYSNNGKIGISYTAISNMIKEALKDVDNVVITKISCEPKDNVFIVNLAIKVDFGTNVTLITDLIQDKTEAALANMCEIGNPKINIKLEGVNMK